MNKKLFRFTIPNFSKRNFRGFTLIELMIGVSIIFILLAVTVLHLNPNEFIAQSKDAQRISDLKRIDTALSLAKNSPHESLEDNTAPSLVYISLPDTSIPKDGLCNEYPDLPPLASGWQYRCMVDDASLKKVDGSGWIPINFDSIAGNPLKFLPIDPVNNDTSYYTFSKAVLNSFALTAPMKSEKYEVEAVNDGGNWDIAYETRPVEWLITAASDYALRFDGSNDNVLVANSASLNLSGAFTMEAWVKAATTAPAFDYRTIIGKEMQSGADRGGYGILSNEDQTGVGFYYTRDIGGSCTVPNLGGGVFYNISSDVWHHIVGVYDGTFITLYDNGVAVEGPVSCAGFSLGTTIKPLYIGGDIDNNSAGTAEFKGDIDKVRIYSRALSPAEVLEHKNGVFNDNTGLVGNWQFSENAGNTTTDSSGNNNNGSLMPACPDCPVWVNY